MPRSAFYQKLASIKSPLNRQKQKTLAIISILIIAVFSPAVWYISKNARKTQAATMALTTDGSSVTVTVDNRYQAVLAKGETSDYMSIKDKYEDNASPDTTYKFHSPCITAHGGNLYCLTYDQNRTTTILESTPTRVKVRVSGRFDFIEFAQLLDDGDGNYDLVTVDYTFTPDGIFVDNTYDPPVGRLFDSDSLHNGYEWLGVYADATDAAFDDTASPAIYYGDGETEGSTTTDEVEFANTNSYVYLPGSGSNTYADALVGISKNGWFDHMDFNETGSHEWKWDENLSGTQDLISTQEQAYSTDPAIRRSSWYFLLQPEANLDTEAEREAWANDMQNPDVLNIATGRQWYDIASPATAIATTSSGSGNYVNIPESTSDLDITGDYTLEAWIYRLDNSDSTILIKGTFSTNDENYCMQTYNNHILAEFNNGDYTYWEGSTSLATNAWQHIAIVYNATDDEFTLYVDGALDSSGKDGNAGDPVSNNSDLNLAYVSGGGFDGYIDEVRIWNTARTQTEIQNTMNQPIDPNTSGLVAYWRFDDGVGTVASDQMGNNPGTLTNSPTWVTGVIPEGYNRHENIYPVDLALDMGQWQIDAGPNASTLLNGALSAESTTVTVDASGTNSFNSNGVGYIHGDKFSYTGTTSTTFTGVPSTSDLAVLDHADNTVVASMNRHNPFFKFRNWRSTGLPSTLTLNGTILTKGTDYNASIKPVTDADFYNATGTSYTQLAVGGDTADSSEYLYDESNDYTLAFNESGDYLYLGSENQFQGINSRLATFGSGSSPVITWQYCSANTDIDTACDTWSTLPITDTNSGAYNFTASGNFYFTAPGDWLAATVNSGPSLYYVRGYLSSGSYSTSPVEDTITTDILVINYLGNMTTEDQTFAINITGDDTASGGPPVTIWGMNENYGSTTYDSSPTEGNDLTITNAAWTWTGDELLPKLVYLQFDGSGDYLSRAHDGDFDFDTGSFTITGWFKHSSNISGTDYLLANFNDAGYKIYMNSSGYLCLGIDADSTWSPTDSVCTTSSLGSLADSRWHHFAAVKSGTASITMYIDGLQASQNASLSATGSLNTDSSLYIGNDTDGGSNGWVGFLDQIVVYNYARSAAQVKVDHNGGTANFGP